MTREDVHALMAITPGDYSSEQYSGTYDSAIKTRMSGVPPELQEGWFSNSAFLVIGFDADGFVVRRFSVHFTDDTYLDRLRRWLGL